MSELTFVLVLHEAKEEDRQEACDYLSCIFSLFSCISWVCLSASIPIQEMQQVMSNTGLLRQVTSKLRHYRQTDSNMTHATTCLLLM